MVLKFMQKNGVAFTPMQVETTGTYICKTLTNTLWYLDPHWEKFEQRSISCVDFQDLRGYNNWRKLKIKEPKVTSEDLTEHISNMITMTSAGYFLNQKFKHFKGMCENLIQGMVKYKKHIDQQAQRSAVNREKTEPVRSLSDHNVLRDLKIGTDIDRNYTLVHESLRTLKEFEPLFLFDYEPEDVYDRKLWLEKMTFPYPVKMYTHKFGNFLGNHTFIWKSPEDTKDLSRATGDLDAITAVKHDLEKFSTRAMRRNFFQKYSKTGAKPAILRSIYRYLTEDDTAPESNEQRAIDTRVSEFLLQNDSTEFLCFDERLAVRFRNESILICLDDKSVVPVGEPGKPVSTGVRAHNKSLVIRGAVLSALDHDFHIHGAVPSVLFKVDIPEHKSDSFYNGTVHVTVKEKVFSPSSPMRHAAESMKILRNGDSEDGLSLTKPILFVYTDGGPDHRSTYWSVQLSYICMFIALDLDMLIAVRTAPSQSYNNPAERCMSLLNIALQNVALHRESMTENLELRVRSLTSLGKIRNAANRDPDLKTNLVDSMEPVLAVLKQRFSKLKFHQEPLLVHDAATMKSEPKVTQKNVLKFFSDDPTPQ
ncbi:uncharacterized protein LOC132729628 [Ruditapes philippinarum]|uniref:uncharacterized protein LOC132729628 n=1 Tax=Ruditapes philippinarum TaxID=129788 RepID=UPI00295AD1C2|nr:uncharacterized protein LOC132729628 [Ruditapes philippinarum]